MFLRGNINTDARVSKEMHTLARGGYRVTLAEVALQAREQTPPADYFEYISVRLWAGGLPRHYLTLPIKFLEMTLRLIGVALRRRPAAIHCHDLDPLLAAALAAGLLRIPLLYDSHEIQLERPSMTRPKWFWLWLERRLARRAAVVIVTDKYRRTIISNILRLQPERMHILMNLPLARDLRSEGKTIRDEMAPQRKIGLFMGALLPDRHLEELAAALCDLPDEYILALVGPIEAAYRDRLMSRIAELGLQSRVFFAGVKPWAELIHYISTADCTFAFYDSAYLNNEYCSPNKLFDSLLAGVPVVATSNPLIVEVMQQTGAGICVKEVCGETIAAAVKDLLPQWDDAGKRRALSEQAKHCYTWETQEEGFLDMYQNVLRPNAD